MITPLIQVRMNSERLPGKAMLPIAGIPMFEHVALAALRAHLEEPIIVVPSGSVNDPIRDYCAKTYYCSTWPIEGVRDPLAEFAYATRFMRNSDWVIRLTGDCPMIQPHHISLFASVLILDEWWVVLTNRPADMDGYDLEMCSVGMLRRAFLRATGEDREHIFPWMYKAESSSFVRRFSVMGNPHDAVTPGKVSVDTTEEYEVVKQLMEQTGPVKLATK